MKNLNDQSALRHIFTASPLPLTRDSWNRDITLIYRGLRRLGVNAKCVRLHTKDGANFPGVLQASMDNMRDADWWRQFSPDAVILNSWANPEYTDIVKAVKNAGAKILVRLDTNGLNSPWINPIKYLHRSYSSFRDRQMPIVKAGLLAAVKLPLYAIPWVYDLKSLAQLELADYVGVESEEAYDRLSFLFRFYNRNHLAGKLAIIRHPAPPNVIETDLAGLPGKERSVVAVGRWSAYMKNTPLLSSMLIEALKKNADYNVHFIGSGQGNIERFIADAPASVKKRVYIHGPLPHNEVVKVFLRSRICVLASRYEGSPLVASEALCCGCSFFAQDNGGVPLQIIRQINAGNGVSGGAKKLAAGLINEFQLWDAGHYNPMRIAGQARNIFSCDSVAKKVLQTFSGDDA